MIPVRKDPPPVMAAASTKQVHSTKEQRAVVIKDPGRWFLVFEAQDNNKAYGAVRTWKSNGFEVCQRRGPNHGDPIGVYAKWNPEE